MKDVVTKSRHLSLAGCKPRISPVISMASWKIVVSSALKLCRYCSFAWSHWYMCVIGSHNILSFHRTILVSRSNNIIVTLFGLCQWLCNDGIDHDGANDCVMMALIMTDTKNIRFHDDQHYWYYGHHYQGGTAGLHGNNRHSYHHSNQDIHRSTCNGGPQYSGMNNRTPNHPWDAKKEEAYEPKFKRNNHVMDQYDRHYKRNDGTVPAKDIRFHSMVVKDSYHGNHTGNKGLHGNRMHFHSSMHELRNANSHGDLTVATQFENTAEEPSKKDKSIFRKFRKNKRKRHRNTIHELQNLSLPHSDPDDFVDVTCQRADDNDVVCVKETSKNRFLQIKRRKAKLAESRKMFSSMPNIASPEHYEETYAGSVYTDVSLVENVLYILRAMDTLCCV